MNNIREREIEIERFKREFIHRFGLGVKVTTCSKWESEANFTTKADFWEIVKLIFDYTGWTWKDTFTKSRLTEKVSRRAIIDFICVNNGVPLMAIGKLTDRDHSTVIHSVTGLGDNLSEDYYIQKLFHEILSYVKENYHLVKGKSTLKNEIISDK